MTNGGDLFIITDRGSRLFRLRPQRHHILRELMVSLTFGEDRTGLAAVIWAKLPHVSSSCSDDATGTHQIALRCMAESLPVNLHELQVVATGRSQSNAVDAGFLADTFDIPKPAWRPSSK